MMTSTVYETETQPSRPGSWSMAAMLRDVVVVRVANHSSGFRLTLPSAAQEMRRVCPSKSNKYI